MLSARATPLPITHHDIAVKTNNRGKKIALAIGVIIASLGGAIGYSLSGNDRGGSVIGLSCGTPSKYLNGSSIQLCPHPEVLMDASMAASTHKVTLSLWVQAAGSEGNVWIAEANHSQALVEGRAKTSVKLDFGDPDPRSAILSALNETRLELTQPPTDLSYQFTVDAKGCFDESGCLAIATGEYSYGAGPTVTSSSQPFWGRALSESRGILAHPENDI